MAIIVTYDVPSSHAALKQQLFSRGYTETVLHFQDGQYLTIYLPNSTLYHPSNSAVTGREDVKDCAKLLHVPLERCIATQWGPDWAVIFGVPF